MLYGGVTQKTNSNMGPAKPVCPLECSLQLYITVNKKFGALPDLNRSVQQSLVSTLVEYLLQENSPKRANRKTLSSATVKKFWGTRRPEEKLQASPANTLGEWLLQENSLSKANRKLLKIS
jgi:hypothetical protein